MDKQLSLQDKSTNINEGHRARLRERFLHQISHNDILLSDVELLENILCFSIPRVDVKPIAYQLIKRFQSLGGVLSADVESLEQVDGIKTQSIWLIKLFYTSNIFAHKYQLKQVNVLQKWENLIDYCYSKFAYKEVEMVHVLYLKSSYSIIHEHTEQGAIDSASINARKLMQNALNKNAKHVIIVHNHPSNILIPSEADIKSTKELNKMLNYIQVKLIDHLIIGADGFYSFKEHNII